jgi:hypothetical protein
VAYGSEVLGTGRGAEWGRLTEMKMRDTRRLGPRKPIFEEKDGGEKTLKFYCEE